MHRRPCGGCSCSSPGCSVPPAPPPKLPDKGNTCTSTEVGAPVEGRPLLSESAIRTRYVDSADEYARSLADHFSVGYTTPPLQPWALSRSPYNPILNTVNVIADESSESDDSGIDSSDSEHSHADFDTALHSEPELGHTPSTSRASEDSAVCRSGSSMHHSPQILSSISRSPAADSAVYERLDQSDQDESIFTSPTTVQPTFDEPIPSIASAPHSYDEPVSSIAPVQHNHCEPVSSIASVQHNHCEPISTSIAPVQHNHCEPISTSITTAHHDHCEQISSSLATQTNQDELTSISRPRCSTLNAQAKAFVPGSQPRTAANSDADKVETQGTAEPHPPIAKRRCRFWPACSNRNCKYIHPQQECQAFPQCSFGTNCIYVHPTDLPKIHGFISGKASRRAKRKTDIVKLNNLEGYLPQFNPPS
ncbi:hypothetical protein IW139_002213 [Coemansia sp. RSA 353]|nr:hypothetical protein IW139_002213 [Coemansia sp. RSA 353]